MILLSWHNKQHLEICSYHSASHISILLCNVHTDFYTTKYILYIILFCIVLYIHGCFSSMQGHRSKSGRNLNNSQE